MNARASATTSSADDSLAQNDDVTLGQMMGMPCDQARRKMVGGFSDRQDAMVFKLSDASARGRRSH